MRPPLEVAELTLRGVEAIDEGRLRAVLETPSFSWAEDYLLDRAALAADLSRIVAYHADHGYPDARLVSHDVAIDRADREASITIRVQEGEAVRPR